MIFTSPKQKQGKQAESHALRHLKKHGLKLIKENFQCRMGEIDLVMLDQDTLVMVEVRLRNHKDYGHAVESVTRNKRKKLWRSAEWFLLNHKNWQNHPVRFDVIGLQETASERKIDWIKNAFDASDC